MDRPRIEVDLDNQQQQRQLQEQQRITEKLPQATEEVQKQLKIIRYLKILLRNNKNN